MVALFLELEIIQMDKPIPSWQPHGKALLSYWKGNKDAQIGILMDDGEEVFMPASIYFRRPEDSPELEEIALNLCKGKVLDVGAGAGTHSLILQEKAIDVTALDIDPIGVDIMQKRGLKQVVCSDFLNFQATEPFDTLIFLMNGIGIAGNLEGLSKCLNHAYEISSKNGQIILDSSDLRISNPDLENNNNYFGEVNYQLSFQGERGSKYQWLYIDPETLVEITRNCKWQSEVVFEAEDGSYLAVLKK